MTRAFDPAEHIRWTNWQPHQGCWLRDRLPALPGLYRIRRQGRTDLDYIGQTGSGSMTLRKRQAMLKGIYAAEMPYRDPHTAGPALWALRHATGEEFEISVAPIEGSTQWRKGMEAVAIALYRQEQGRSPTMQWGRMPIGYRMSSANNARLVAAGRRFRGGPAAEGDESHILGVPPVNGLEGDPNSLRWAGHTWSPWMPIATTTREIPSVASGLYRIRHTGWQQVVYIGEGIVRSRLLSHLTKAALDGHRQAAIFTDIERLEASWVINSEWKPHQRRELENDLIAAHVLATARVPAAQFLG